MHDTFNINREKSSSILHSCTNCHSNFYIRFNNVRNSTSFLANCPFCKAENYIFRNKDEARKINKKEDVPPTKSSKEQNSILFQDLSSDSSIRSTNLTSSIKKNSFPPSIPIKNNFEQTVKTNKIALPTKKEIKKNKKVSVFKFFCYSFSSLGLISFLFLYLSLHLFPQIFLEYDLATYWERLHSHKANQILDREDKLIGELFKKKLGTLKRKDIPSLFKNLLIFIEDKNFYKHSGIDYLATLRSFYYNIKSLSYQQGASTISQQLARLLLYQKEKTITRKIKELALSYSLEKKFSKEEILEAYSNLVYLGHGAYGFGNASNFYFGKDLKDLNFIESLILISLNSAPERYSPFKNPHLLKIKLSSILSRINKDYSIQKELELPKDYQAELRLAFYSFNKSPSANVYHERINQTPYVNEYIRQKISHILGKEYMYNAGLVVKTSIDLKLQKGSQIDIQKFAKKYNTSLKIIQNKKNIKQQAIEQTWKDFEFANYLFSFGRLPLVQKNLQVASIAIENKTGSILLMQGGSRFGTNNQLNRSISMYRQTGSAIKAILYAIALQEGVVHSGSFLDDRPIFRKEKKKNKAKKDYWSPSNYNNVYEGEISLDYAFSHSKNLPAIQLANKLGMPKLSKGFSRFFFPQKEVFQKRFRSDETIAIGSLEMSPLEIAMAYSAFANNGKIQRPKLIESIHDANGHLLYKAKKDTNEFNLNIPPQRKVIDADVAEIIWSLLKSSANVYRSTIPRRLYQRQNFIGKTGTSNLSRDLWFIGSTPELTLALWIGSDDPRYSLSNYSAQALASPLWAKILLHKTPKPKAKFSFSPSAKKVFICSQTGKLYTKACRGKKKLAYFRRKDNTKLLLKNKETKAKTRRKKELPFLSEF